MMKVLNVILTAAVTGGIGALGTQIIDKNEFGQGLDLHRIAIVFAIGALAGVVNHYRTPPGKVSVPESK